MQCVSPLFDITPVHAFADDNQLLINRLSVLKQNKNFFIDIKVSNVRRASLGPKGNLWQAVKAAKNVNREEIPSNLTLGGFPLTPVTLLTVLPGTSVLR